MRRVQALEAQVRATEDINAGLRVDLQAGQVAFDGAKAEVRPRMWGRSPRTRSRGCGAACGRLLSFETNGRLMQ